jgi:hypothetical protein
MVACEPQLSEEGAIVDLAVNSLDVLDGMLSPSETDRSDD